MSCNRFRQSNATGASAVTIPSARPSPRSSKSRAHITARVRGTGDRCAVISTIYVDK